MISPEKLTEAEQEVFQFLAYGLTNTEISESRHTARRTTDKVVVSIYEKLGLTGTVPSSIRVRAALMFWGINTNDHPGS